METSKWTLSKKIILASHRHYLPTCIRSCSYAVTKSMSIYRHETNDCRCLIQGMLRNVKNITEWRCQIYGLQQNVIKYNGI